MDYDTWKCTDPRDLRPADAICPTCTAELSYEDADKVRKCADAKCETLLCPECPEQKICECGLTFCLDHLRVPVDGDMLLCEECIALAAAEKKEIAEKAVQDALADGRVPLVGDWFAAGRTLTEAFERWGPGKQKDVA